MSQGAEKGFSTIGKSLPRLDGPAKVTGRAVFTDDINLPGMVYGRIKGADRAHARIVGIDTSEAEALPGVLAIITGQECPKAYSVNDHLPTEYPLTPEKVVYFGEGVAAVAALDEDTANDALELIEIEYQDLPVLTDPQEAAARDDVRIHDFAPFNLHVEGEQVFGDPDQALASSHLVVDHHCFSSYVTGAFLEPQSAVSDYDPGTGILTLYTCNQLPHYLHQTLSRTLEMPMEKIRVIIPTVGGGFGGKTEATPASLVSALLSRKLGRPVKITYDRPEAFYQNKGRHPAEMKIKMGFDEEGRITGIDFDSTLDGGAHSSWGFVVLWFTAALVQLPYKIPNIRFNGRRFYTNKPACGAQRGLAGVQVRIGIEALLDKAAAELKISPLKLRLINAVESGYQAPSVVEVGHSELKKCLEEVDRVSGYEEKHGRLPFGKGVGLACGHYSSGGAFLLYNSLRSHSTANVRVDNEAGVTLFVGATDIGQGSGSVLCQMAAEVLGLDYRDIHLVAQDTTLAPMDNGTYDSRTTYGAGHAVKRACLEIKSQLLKSAAVGLRVREEHLELGEGMVFSTYDPKKRITFAQAVAGHLNSVGPLFGTGEYTPPQPKGKYPGGLIGPSPAFGFTAQVAEVEVDQETGRIRIVKYYEAGDCGQAINPMSVEGQVEGGISMGIGQALYEEMSVDETGRLNNPNFHDYKLPTAMDMPEIDSNIVDSYDPESAFGNKETGEGPTCPVVPAILNAIHDAIGVRFTELPVTPEKVLRALGKLD